MTRILIVIALVLAAGVVHGQQNCAQTLRLASSSYDQGRLHELPGLLKGCLTSSNGFSNAEKVTAYKLLVLSYIYLEEPAKADSTMIELLNTDHFFEPNQSVDPAEFIGLYNTFRTKPIFSIGVKFGVNLTLPSVISNYYTGNNAAGKGTYSPSIGIQGGLSFEKKLFQRSKNDFLKRFTFAPEVLYVARSFSYSNTVFTTDNPQVTSGITPNDYTESQTWIGINPLLQYQLRKDSRFNPYVMLGPGIDLLIGNSVLATTTRGTTGSVASGPSIDVKNSYQQVIYSVIAGAGAKYKIGGLFATFELRYQHGLVNAINPARRTNSEFTFDYGGQFNDYSLNNLSVMGGVSVPIFKPQKLHKKKSPKTSKRKA